MVGGWHAAAWYARCSVIPCSSTNYQFELQIAKYEEASLLLTHTVLRLVRDAEVVRRGGGTVTFKRCQSQSAARDREKKREGERERER